MAEAATPDPVYGSPASSHAAWIQPSSPNRPCRARNATSTPASRIVPSQSSRMSISRTSHPSLRSAAAAAAPVRRETSRSADTPPRNTPTFLPANANRSDIEIPPHFDLGQEQDAAGHPPRALSTGQEPPDIRSGGASPVHEEICVLLGEAGVPFPLALHSRPLEQLPGLSHALGRIAERGPKGLLSPRLAGTTLLVELPHPLEHGLPRPGPEPEPGPHNDPLDGIFRLAVPEPDRPRLDPVNLPFGVDHLHPLHQLPDALPVRPGVHRQRAAHRSRDPRERLYPRKSGPGTEHGQPGKHRSRLDDHRPVGEEHHLGEVLLRAQHGGRHAFVRHQEVGSRPQDLYRAPRATLGHDDLPDLRRRPRKHQPIGGTPDPDGGVLPQIHLERDLNVPHDRPGLPAPPAPTAGEGLRPVSRHRRPPSSERCPPVAGGREPPPPHRRLYPNTGHPDVRAPRPRCTALRR